MIHEPVLLKEVVEALDPQKGDLVIDGTAGAGGHAKEILKLIGNGRMFLFDWDQDTASELGKEMRNFPNVEVVNASYSEISGFMQKSGNPKADCLLLDLGFSSDQLLRGRGFSFSDSAADEPLLMTYSDRQKPLLEIIPKLTEGRIFEILRDFGEERYAKAIAKNIYEERLHIRTSGDLARIVSASVPKSYERGRIHPATRTFQAFRIYVNDELGNLRKVLEDAPKIMKSGGRVAIISFHSLEDRIVKEEFKKMEKEGLGESITKKPIVAGIEEVVRNPRSRSAKLRALKIL